jgi:hypothetical protein
MRFFDFLRERDKEESVNDTKSKSLNYIWAEGYVRISENWRQNFKYEPCVQYNKNDIDTMCTLGVWLDLEFMIQFFGEKSNRFFKVKALVDEEDYSRGYSLCRYQPLYSLFRVKAQSIIFIKELSDQEIIENAGIDTNIYSTPEEWKQIREVGWNTFYKNTQINKLLNFGLDNELIQLILKNNKYETALIIMPRKDLTFAEKLSILI